MEIVAENETWPVVHPYCQVCGWRKGGRDSWNGFACKCGHSEPAIRRVSMAWKCKCGHWNGGPYCDECTAPPPLKD